MIFLYIGLFIITLSTLFLELLLTRVFSVTMWYHYAFMAISIAMFGMTAGAIIVYLKPLWFQEGAVRKRLAQSALLFAIFIALSFVIQLRVPFIPSFVLTEMYPLLFIYLIVALPFIFSGICVCLALTKFPRDVSKLYCVDLLGAGMGCMLLIPLLNLLDGPTAVLVISVIASVGAIFFSLSAKKKILAAFSIITMIILLVFTFYNYRSQFLRVRWVKGHYEERHLYEKWNAFSRIVVDPAGGNPVGWFSPFYRPPISVQQLKLDIDANAATFITNFDGDINKVEYLQYDVSFLVHYLRSPASVLVIGVGGGRDILAALFFKQPKITGVEINKAIIEAVDSIFGEFSGYLYQRPEVTVINDEARSFIAGSKDNYDIIQASLVDTWAATAAGAFVLTENSLYTKEAWVTFLKHLKPSGILTMSRWYYANRPIELYRLTTLAVAALKEIGVTEPSRHILIASVKRDIFGDRYPIGLGTILVSKSPLSEEDINKFMTLCKRFGFDVLQSPGYHADVTFEGIALGKDLDEFCSSYPINICPPDDDKPFFFNMLRFKNIFNAELLSLYDPNFRNMKAVVVLGSLLIIVVTLSVLFIILPLLLKQKKGDIFFFKLLPGLVFFAAIGLGFMVIEISQLQRLIIFLGHPIYGLSVVLFSLLISSGIGSLTTTWIIKAYDNRKVAFVIIAFLIGILVLFGIFTPFIIKNFGTYGTPIRILVSIIILVPIGFFMGMPFPLGLNQCKDHQSYTPWFWGINGATSICASVLAVAIAMTIGITATFYVGVLCYLMAAFAIIKMT